VLAFLRKFQGQSLLANVNLDFESYLSREILQPILGQILPLVGINSISFFDKDLLAEMQNASAGDANTNANDEFWQLITKMLARTRILSIKLEKRGKYRHTKNLCQRKTEKWWSIFSNSLVNKRIVLAL
jgi:hypothetical protein